MSFTWIDKRNLTQPKRGTFLGLGSPHAVRVAAQLGFDWVLIDLEHGLGTEATLPALLAPLEGTPCSPIVRVVWNDQNSIKRALDLGAVGVMVPYVSNAEEASAAVSYTRYPPDGVRGVASTTSANAFGISTAEYLKVASDRVLTVVQIETREGVENADAIAAVDGVDVLFVGPLDLSYNLGCPNQFDHPDELAAFDAVIAACRNHGKAAGILSKVDTAAEHSGRGFTFVAVGSDGFALRSGLQSCLQA